MASTPQPMKVSSRSSDSRFERCSHAAISAAKRWRNAEQMPAASRTDPGDPAPVAALTRFFSFDVAGDVTRVGFAAMSGAAFYAGGPVYRGPSSARVAITER